MVSMDADYKSRLAGIAEKTINRYCGRLKKFGYDPRTLGWGDRQQQHYRFAQTLAGPIEFNARTVLDIGCGFGDYRDFLHESEIAVAAYKGWDINADLVTEASRRHRNDLMTEFSVFNLLSPDLDEAAIKPIANIGVMLGVLNFNLGDQASNYRYTDLALTRAWGLVDTALVVDFLSAHRTPNYAAEPGVFYHDPSRMIEYALSLSSSVTLMHNYLPIPQREFMLFIERE